MAGSRKRKRVAILISGRGSNMDALVGAAEDPDFPGEIVAVVSNRPNAQGLSIAASRGIETRAIDHRAFADRAAHETATLAALDEIRPDVICLAGYMRILSADFVQRHAGRMINIHPSLLPLFPGLATHRRALEAGMRIHGCTVHFVTSRMDEGPIIAQAAVPVLISDSEDTLQRRVLKAEHRLYPLALSLVCNGRARMEDDRTVFDGEDAASAGKHMLVAPDFSRDIPNLEDLARFTT